MSANNFSITGEVFKVVINENPNIGIMTTAAFAALENQNPNRDWSAFDQRQNFPNFSYDNSVYKSNGDPAGGDGKLDFVFIHFRKNNVGANIAGLWSSPTLTTTFGGGKSYTTGAGATLANLFKHDKLMEYFTHEFAHNLYNSPHYMGANGMSGKYYYLNKGWGMMSYFATMHTSNAWEKWLLGWINMDNKTITSNTQYVLKDFVTQNDAIRIPIPNTSPQQYLWIENHQKEHFLDEKIFYKDASPMGKGIYAFISGNGNDCNNLSTFKFDWNTSSITNMFKVLSAKGNKDYSYTISSHNPYGGYFNTFSILADNPISGQTSVTAIRNDFNSNEIIEYCLNPNNHNGCPDDQEGMWVEDNSLTWAYSGSANDAFDVGDEISISGICLH